MVGLAVIRGDTKKLSTRGQRGDGDAVDGHVRHAKLCNGMTEYSNQVVFAWATLKDRLAIMEVAEIAGLGIGMCASLLS